MSALTFLAYGATSLVFLLPFYQSSRLEPDKPQVEQEQIIALLIFFV
jgi:hypothetical protein